MSAIARSCGRGWRVRRCEIVVGVGCPRPVRAAHKTYRVARFVGGKPRISALRAIRMRRRALADRTTRPRAADPRPAVPSWRSRSKSIDVRSRRIDRWLRANCGRRCTASGIGTALGGAVAIGDDCSVGRIGGTGTDGNVQGRKSIAGKREAGSAGRRTLGMLISCEASRVLLRYPASLGLVLPLRLLDLINTPPVEESDVARLGGSQAACRPAQVHEVRPEWVIGCIPIACSRFDLRVLPGLQANDVAQSLVPPRDSGTGDRVNDSRGRSPGSATVLAAVPVAGGWERVRDLAAEATGHEFVSGSLRARHRQPLDRTTGRDRLRRSAAPSIASHSARRGNHGRRSNDALCQTTKNHAHLPSVRMRTPAGSIRAGVRTHDGTLARRGWLPSNIKPLATY
jgi:hypothetical protein